MFRVEDAQIEALIQKDGVIQVKETMTYAFREPYGSIERKMTDPAIEWKGAFENGRRLPHEIKGETLYVYRPGYAGDVVTIEWIYDVKGAVEKAEDAALLKWSFFDHTYKGVIYDRMTVQIIATDENVTMDPKGLGWMYDRGKVMNDRMVTYEVGFVPPEVDGEVYLLFSPDFLTEMETQHATKKEAWTLAYEKKVAAEKRSSHGAPVLLTYAIVTMLFTLYFIWKLWRRRRRLKKDAAQIPLARHKVPNIHRLPFSLLVFFMNGQQLTGSMMRAMMYRWLDAGAIRASEEHPSIFLVVDQDLVPAYERPLLHFIFKTIGTEGVLERQTLENFLRDAKKKGSVQRNIAYEFRRATQTLKRALRSTSFYEKKETSGVFTALLVYFVLHAIGVALSIYYHVWGMTIWFGIWSVVFLVSYGRRRARSATGEKIAAQWALFQKRYDEGLLTEEVWVGWTDDEKVFVIPYFIALTDTKKRRTRQQFERAQEEDELLSLYPFETYGISEHYRELFKECSETYRPSILSFPFAIRGKDFS